MKKWTNLILKCQTPLKVQWAYSGHLVHLQWGTAHGLHAIYRVGTAVTLWQGTSILYIQWLHTVYIQWIHCIYIMYTLQSTVRTAATL